MTTTPDIFTNVHKGIRRALFEACLALGRAGGWREESAAARLLDADALAGFARGGANGGAEKAPAITPSAPAITPSAPAITPSAPAITPSAPAITPPTPAIIRHGVGGILPRNGAGRRLNPGPVARRRGGGWVDEGAGARRGAHGWTSTREGASGLAGRQGRERESTILRWEV
jgi:hypothetical protein